ncbi:MAG TPA: glycine zipper domain-containing protein [Candidatus Saccharimonadia bacterium]|nr:glycine zipper domain-containing protein [Candidatus Saccharimonadia bacterium]
MKTTQKLLLPLLAAASFSTMSCSSGPNARTGTVIGALGGGALGGIIGHQSGHGLEGAAIGAGLGALGGNVIGGAQDERYYGGRRVYYREQPTYYRRPAYGPRYYY